MKAMLLEHQGPIGAAPLRPADLPLPTPGPGEVRVKVSCCTICRTDLHVIEGDLPPRKCPSCRATSSLAASMPWGRMCARCNSASGSAAPGCGTRAGNAVLYLRGGKTSALTRGSPATMPTAATPSTRYCPRRSPTRYRTPSATWRGRRCCVAGIIGYRALRRSCLPRGGRLAIYGFGSSAHVVIQIALHRGCEVYVATRDAAHQELARQMGAGGREGGRRRCR